MKQLILYFLFFVVAALILVQCAKFFPSKNKTSGQPAPSAKNEKKSAEKLTFSANGYVSIPVLQTPQKEPIFRIPFNEPAFALNMVNYINHYQFLGYQYFGLYHHFINAKHLFLNPHNNSFSNLLSKSDSSVLTASIGFEPKNQ